MAVTSNIHYNLTAWASGSFTVGNRRSTGGNAYQCITAGTSTVAPTGTGSSINNGGTAVWKWLSAIDYTSLASWSVSIPSTLTQPYVALLWNNGSITTTSGVAWLNLTGHTTSASNNITVTCAPGESFRNNSVGLPLAFSTTTGVNFLAPASGVGNVNYFNIDDNFVVFDGLQVKDPNATSGSTLIATSTGLTIQGCVIDGTSQTGGASLIQAKTTGTTTAKFTFINNLVLDRSTTSGALTFNTNYNNAFACNTIISTNAASGLLCILNQGNSSVSTSTTDNIIIGYAAGLTIGSASGAVTSAQYSLFSSTILTGGVTLGSGNLYSQTAAAQFISATTNFRLLATSAAVDSGLTDTTDVPSSTDIFGATRPQGSAWDMGCAEYMAAKAVGTSGITFAATGTTATASRSSGTSTITFAATAHANVGMAVGTSSITFAANGVGQAPSFGTSSITFVATAYDASGAISAVIAIDPIPVQRPDTPFVVSGSYTLVPDLQFADDAGTTFTQIPEANASPLGEVEFSFVHPGVPTGGTQTLVVSDTSTGDAGTTSYLVQAEAPRFASAFPPDAQTTTKGIIPSYLYEQYNDDDNLWALVNSYNGLAQGYLDWFNNINLPVYTGDQISGSLLDWVATGIYGLPRPTLSYSAGLPSVGPFNTYPLDSIAFDTGNTAVTTTVFNVTDDIYKRILTWCFYKGDGFVFTARWLKRRVMRFLAGVNGTDPGVNQTYQISVKYTGTTVVNITISSGTAPTTYAPVLRAAILSGVLPLPFQYSYNVLIS
jgi:hypothetical protein